MPTPVSPPATDDLAGKPFDLSKFKAGDVITVHFAPVTWDPTHMSGQFTYEGVPIKILARPELCPNLIEKEKLITYMQGKNKASNQPYEMRLHFKQIGNEIWPHLVYPIGEMPTEIEYSKPFLPPPNRDALDIFVNPLSSQAEKIAAWHEFTPEQISFVFLRMHNSHYQLTSRPNKPYNDEDVVFFVNQLPKTSMGIEAFQRTLILSNNIVKVNSMGLNRWEEMQAEKIKSEAYGVCAPPAAVIPPSVKKHGL